jgi:hypothetical protein
MFYTTSDYGGGNREFRVIPTDGRKHDPQRTNQETYMGYTVGRWEGDTPVLDSISFVDSPWLGRGGLFHSGNMHIVEKFTRKGDDIVYEITVEDPDVFVEPWVMPPRTLRINRTADAGLVAELRTAKSTRATSRINFATNRKSASNQQPVSESSETGCFFYCGISPIGSSSTNNCTVAQNHMIVGALLRKGPEASPTDSHVTSNVVPSTAGKTDYSARDGHDAPIHSSNVGSRHRLNADLLTILGTNCSGVKEHDIYKHSNECHEAQNI